MTVVIVKNEGGDLKHAQTICKGLELTNAQYINPYNNVLDVCPIDKLIISVGSPALRSLEELSNTQYDGCIYWGAHQLTDYDKNILVKIALNINIIALPAGVISNNKDFLYSDYFQKTTFVETVAVPTLKLNNQELLESYKSLDSQYPMINLKGHYIIVSPPGDAPDSNNELKVFDNKSAKKLFDMVCYIWQQQISNRDDVIVLVENSRRTGKSLGFIHTYYENIDESVDDISKFFISLLNENNIRNQFYPFAIKLDSNGEKTATISAHNALVYAAQYTNAIYIVPGESTSQMGEIHQYIQDPKSIIAFSPSSQNDAHRLSMKHSYELGCFSIWNGNEILYPSTLDNQKCISDANKVVEAISGCLSDMSIEIE